jgi:phosphate transport system permease protein
MLAQKSSFTTDARCRKGESFVWLTAAGLTAGITMTVALLLFLLYQGLSSFWPNQIEVLDLQTDGTTSKVAGIVVDQRTRKSPDGIEKREWQIFRGNKDLYGESFLFLDENTITGTSAPTDYWLIERMEYGNAIGAPQSYTNADGSTLAATDGNFATHLRDRIEYVDGKRDLLLEIERKKLGKVNRELDKIDINLKTQRITAEQADAQRLPWQQQFETLTLEARTMREEIAKESLLVRTVDDKELNIPLSQLVHFYAPNQGGFFSKLGEALHRVWNFVSEEPRAANTEGGVFPAIFGTVIMTLLMSLFVTPLGVVAAIYLREYAKQGMLVKAVRISVNNLAGVPSIVFGVFGVAFFIYFIGSNVDAFFFSDKLPTPTYGTGGIFWASLTLALLTLPVVIVATEEAIAAVPRGVREAALACGASKWQMIQRVVLPASVPGILTGVILAMARGAGEVAPLMIVGVVKFAPSLPLDDISPFIHPERKFMHLGFHIYDLGFQSPDAEAAKPMVYATTLLLILIVVVMNLTAITLRNRIRKKFASNTF